MNYSRSDELEQFKTQINLCEFAASKGFVIDPKQSSRASAVMRHSTGDKIIVARSPSRHWMFFNVHDSRDRGTIIDFLQFRDRLSLGEVRKQLRLWLGHPESEILTTVSRHPDLVPSEFDVTRVHAVWWDALPPLQNRYLEQQRQIPEAIFLHPIFSDRIRVDRRQNLLFAHHSLDGICGFEMKNEGFTGFSPGGVKGLWCSRPRPEDEELVVCETAIDALSYATLFGTEGRRFVSTAGQLSPLQRELLKSAAQKLGDYGSIVLALDNDAGGRQLAASLQALLAEVDLGHRQVVTSLPEPEGNDWNDVLRTKQSLAPQDTPTPH